MPSDDTNTTPLVHVDSTALLSGLVPERFSADGLKAGDYAIFPKLRVHPDAFRCPVCDQLWLRHGRGDGFRKASASRHIVACWDRVLSAEGLVMGKWDESNGGHRLISVTPKTSNVRADGSLDERKP